MGLDTFAVVEKSDGSMVRAPDELFDGVILVCGIMAGSGASFRGQRYANMIEAATGVSLYTQHIPASKVKEMAQNISKVASVIPDCTHEGRDHDCWRCDTTKRPQNVMRLVPDRWRACRGMSPRRYPACRPQRLPPLATGHKSTPLDKYLTELLDTRPNGA